MVQVLEKLVTFEEFLEFYPENGHYELIKGVIVEMQPKGKHEEIGSFLTGELWAEIRRLKLPYFFPKQGLIKLPNQETSYLPDVLVIDRNCLQNEPLWEKSSTITQGKSIKLVIEVISTNWRDDYVDKLSNYEQLGITEYWLIDYLGLGGVRYIGNPKQPTITICNLIDGEYQLQQFRSNDQLISTVFPQLNLTVSEIFEC